MGIFIRILLAIILGFAATQAKILGSRHSHHSHGQFQVHRPWPGQLNLTGWHFFLARNPPQDLDDCAHYFYSCTDWEEPDYTEYIPSAAINEKVKCDDGWIPNSDTGYCYKISTNRTNWQTARRLCQNEDAEIVSIRSSIENDFVKGLMRSTNENLGFWLGGNDLQSEGTWVWVDESPVTFTDWQNGQPYDSNDRKNCMLLWHSDYKWHNEACTDWRDLPTVCKKIGQVILSKPSEICESGWTENTATGNCYKVLINETEWNYARLNCESEGAELSTIRSSQEWDFVKEYLTQNNYSTGDVWLGGSDAKEEGTWLWMDGTAVTIFDWNQGDPIQPNNDGDCLRAGHEPPTMWDGSCFDYYPALCQKPGKSKQPTTTTTPTTTVTTTPTPLTTTTTPLTTTFTLLTTTTTPLPTTTTPLTTTTTLLTTTTSPLPTTTTPLTTTTTQLTTAANSTSTSSSTPTNLDALRGNNFFDSCANGWTEDPVTGSCYKVLTIKIDWFGARKNCESLGAELASIRSRQEWNFVKGYLSKTGVNDNVWLGGNDISKEGVWKWTDGSLVTFSDWEAKQPDNYLGGQNCNLMWYRNGWRWDDEMCIYYTNALCKIPGLTGQRVNVLSGQKILGYPQNLTG